MKREPKLILLKGDSDTGRKSSEKWGDFNKRKPQPTNTNINNNNENNNFNNFMPNDPTVSLPTFSPSSL